MHRANLNGSFQLQTASPLLLLLPLPQPDFLCVFDITEVFGLASPQVFIIRENSRVPEAVAPAATTPWPDKFPLLQTVWTYWVSVLSLLWGCDILFLNSSNVTLLYAWFLGCWSCGVAVASLKIINLKRTMRSVCNQQQRQGVHSANFSWVHWKKKPTKKKVSQIFFINTSSRFCTFFVVCRS